MRIKALIVTLIFNCISIFGQSEIIEPFKILQGHKFKVGPINFSKNNNYLISASWDNSVRVWDIDSFKCIKVLKGHEDNVWACDISSDNNLIASASLDRQFKIWDFKSGKELLNYKLEPHDIIRKGLIPEIDRPFPNSAYSVAFSPDNKYIAVGAADSLVRLFDAKTYALIDTLKNHTRSILGVKYSSDGRYLISGGPRSNVVIWETDKYEPLYILKNIVGYCGAFTFTNDNKEVLITGKCKIVVIDIASGKIIRTIPVQCALQSVQLTSDEKYMITCAEDHTVRLYDYKTGKEIWIYKNPKPEICDCKLSPDNKYLAVSTPEGNILIWKMDDLTRNK